MKRYGQLNTLVKKNKSLASVCIKNVKRYLSAKKLFKYQTFRASPFISGNNNVVLYNTTELMFKSNVQSPARAETRAQSK